ncbi:MAG: hypothetical protein WC523_00555 [Patescibacteria group bacterium]
MAYKNFDDFRVDAVKNLGDVLSATSDLPNTRLGAGITNRDKQIMTWLLPNGTSVQMYINPENFVVAESKQIQQTRTKGGFVVQYWGDNLTRLTLNGTTGSAGVKGINVLRDVYRSENRIFEVVAASQTNELLNALQQTTLQDASLGDAIVPVMAEQLRNNNFILRPSLASLALGITLFYQGIEYRGFFTSMTTTEDVNRLGLFQYNIEFMVTETRGKRVNFMAWHKDPIADDVTGQFVNAMASSAGNAIRGLFGLSPQQNNVDFRHPESAPLSYGGNSLSSTFGINNG